MSRIFLLILGATVFASALGVVYTKYVSRKLFVEFEGLQQAHDELNLEWGRLQLEQSTWATHGRVDAAARESLHMHLPEQATVVIVKP